MALAAKRRDTAEENFILRREHELKSLEVVGDRLGLLARLTGPSNLFIYLDAVQNSKCHRDHLPNTEIVTTLITGWISCLMKSLHHDMIAGAWLSRSTGVYKGRSLV